MLSDIRFVRSMMKRAARELRSSLRLIHDRRVMEGNGTVAEQPSSGMMQVDSPPKDTGEWQRELERKIDRARVVIRENELNMKVLFLKEQRLRNRKEMSLW